MASKWWTNDSDSDNNGTARHLTTMWEREGNSCEIVENMDGKAWQRIQGYRTIQMKNKKAAKHAGSLHKDGIQNICPTWAL
jgi:hypothetical protein